MGMQGGYDMDKMAPATSQADPDWPELRHQRRAIVVVDVVESVRLMQANEADVIDRWRRFVNEVRTQVLPVHGGRLVKSLGDGLLLEFEAVPAAVAASFEIQRRAAPYNAGREALLAMQLRVGIHVADVVVDDFDIYGVGVNLAARISTLARPGEVIGSAETKDRLVLGLDANVEDMGACYLKHLSEPVQAYRLHPIDQSAVPIRPARSDAAPVLPTVAVVPFDGLSVSPPHDVFGELIGDGVVARLSSSGAIRVISRLSTSVLRARTCTAREIGALLGATFVVSGTYRMVGDRVVMAVELADAESQEVAWTDTMSCPHRDILEAENFLAGSICSGIMGAISDRELDRVRHLPIPNLKGFSLQRAGVVLMHRASRSDFERGRELLEHLVDRYPRAPEPRAWLAKWYVLRVSFGLVENLAEEASRALEHTQRALDASPDSSLALAMEGFVHCHMFRDLDRADQRLDQALRINPNESVAWLYKCVTQGFRGDGQNAMESAERAISLSPLDPLRHYYDGLAASAAVAVGNLNRAIELANRSLKVNANHLPTLRALAVAQVESGAVADARQTGARILRLEPGMTVRDYVARGPKGSEATRLRYGPALREAGIPAD
jgi:adenylate cyclase